MMKRPGSRSDLLLPEDRAKHLVATAKLSRPMFVEKERQDLLGVLGRHTPAGCPDIREDPEGNPERDRDPVEAVDRNRLLPALHLPDELAAQGRALAEHGLAELSPLAQLADALAEKLPDVRDRPFAHVPDYTQEEWATSSGKPVTRGAGTPFTITTGAC